MVRSAAANLAASFHPAATNLSLREASPSAFQRNSSGISSRLRTPVENPTPFPPAIHAVLYALRTHLPAFARDHPQGSVRRLENPPETLLSGPLFLVAVFSPVRFWKPRTHSPPSIHRDLPLLSTLPPTTTSTTRNIYTFTLFLRSILPGRHLSPHHPTPRPNHPTLHPHAKSLAVCAGPHKMPPEIHRVEASHETPRTT
jgi:hypothetical protein